MLRALLALLLVTLSIEAATIRLYLKDGSYHSVREYQKLGDRVRFYSTERGDWEEIPLELVDLKRTETETAANESKRKEQAAIIDAEEKAEREQSREIERIPMEPGVFMTEGENVSVIKQAEVKVVNNKRRSVLKAISPIPVLTGQSTVELEGLQATTILSKPRPEFYVRPSGPERIDIVRMLPGKKTRIVQKWDIVPVSNEMIETTDTVEVFRQQLNEGLFKVWPTVPLPPGQYAVVQYTQGKGDIQVWDFMIPGTPPPPSKPVKKGK